MAKPAATRKTKQSTSADRLEARRLFVNERMTCEAIAAKIGFSRATVHGWKQKAKKKQDDWEEAQKAAAIAGEGSNAAIANVVHIFTNKMEDLAKKADLEAEDMTAKQLADIMSSAADSMVKMKSVAMQLAPNISEYAVADDTMRRLLDFVKSDFPQHAKAIAEVLEPFSEVLAREYKR